MKPNYCLPIIASNKSDVLKAVQDDGTGYRYIEVWLDYVKDVDESFVKQLTEELGDKLIALFRRQNLDAPVMDPTQRTGLLDALTGTPALIDLDITTQVPELDHIRSADGTANLIASYHNYEETPDSLQLEKIIGTMEAYGPAVYKLSTLCRTEGDAARLLKLLLKLKEKGMRAVVSGMGKHGAVTRVFGTLWGNEMVFAPVTKESGSAPGQLTRQQLEIIFKELGK